MLYDIIVRYDCANATRIRGRVAEYLLSKQKNVFLLKIKKNLYGTGIEVRIYIRFMTLWPSVNEQIISAKTHETTRCKQPHS